MSEVELKWLHAAGHAGSTNQKVIEFARSFKALVIDWSEMYWNTDELLKHGKGYNHFVGTPGKVDARGRVVNHDVVLSTRMDAEVLHDEEFFVARAFLPNLKFMPTRYGKARVIRWRGETILIIAWHPQPKPTKWLGVVLSGYRGSVRRVTKIQRKLDHQFNPTLVLNGGDLQLPAGVKWYYPNKLAYRLKMATRHHTIDWQMWKPNNFRPVDFTVHDPSVANPKMDHLWTLLTLRKS